MDHFMSSHVFCPIRRDGESALLLIGTFKQFSVLKWFSKQALDSAAALASRHSMVRMQPLYMWLHETQKSALNQPNTADFNSASLLWGGKSGFAAMWVCDRKAVSTVPATQLLTKRWILNQLSHVNISCSQFYQDMSSSVWVPPCLLHIKHIWSWGLARRKVKEGKVTPNWHFWGTEMMNASLWLLALNGEQEWKRDIFNHIAWFMEFLQVAAVWVFFRAVNGSLWWTNISFKSVTR